MATFYSPKQSASTTLGAMVSLTQLPVPVQRAVRPFLESPAPRAAVFDADGTLWRGDVGEDFLRYLGANGLLPNAPPNVYARYEALHEREPTEAYGFAVRAMEGVAEAELERWSTQFFEQRFRGKLFGFVRPLFELLGERQIAIWVCSASPRWIVEAGAQSLGLDRSHVIAVDAEVRNGRLTTELKLPVTAGEGKVTWLARRGVSFGLAAGNGELDLPMLEAAPHRLVVAPFDGAENALVRHGRARDWPILKT